MDSGLSEPPPSTAPSLLTVLRVPEPGQDTFGPWLGAEAGAARRPGSWAPYARSMRLVIRGHHLPGRTCGSYADIHVGLQLDREPAGLVPGDADSADWVTEIRTDGGDFRGPAVQGRKGDRFVYLTWGTVSDGSFTMFRRAKLMLADLPRGLDEITVEIDLTDDQGMPRCARLRAPVIRIV